MDINELLEYMEKVNRFLGSFGWKTRRTHKQVVALIKTHPAITSGDIEGWTGETCKLGGKDETM